MNKALNKKIKLTALFAAVGLMFTVLACKCDLDDDNDDHKEKNTAERKIEQDSLALK